MKAPSDLELLSGTMEGGTLALVGRGNWTAAEAEAIDRSLSRHLPALAGSRAVSIDFSGIGAFDTYGACLLDRLLGEARSRGIEAEVTGLETRFAALHAAVTRAERLGAPAASDDHPIMARLVWLGEAVTELGRDFLRVLDMTGNTMAALARVVRRPAGFRLTSTVHHIDRVGLQAVPIILLITFLIGSIIAQQGFFHFRKFGADAYVVDMVGILVAREIGVLIVTIMVAGRSGSAYTAELGSMKMREEIDALKTMGFDPVDVLVLPRVLALVVALPLLTFVGMMSALYGAGLVAWAYGDMSPASFIERLKEAITLAHFKVGMIKAPFMALVIGIVACTECFKVKGSAQSLGARTTSSVVKAIFMVIVLEGLFAMFFAAIGM